VPDGHGEEEIADEGLPQGKSHGPRGELDPQLEDAVFVRWGWSGDKGPGYGGTGKEEEGTWRTALGKVEGALCWPCWQEQLLWAGGWGWGSG
jgi:hypothetical protein